MFLNSLLVSYQDYFETGEGDNIISHYDYPDVWTSFAKDNLMFVFLYAAIALVVILLAVGVFVRYKKPASLNGYTHTALTLAVGFAVTVIVTMLSLEFLDMQENGYVFDIVLWPAVASVAAVILGVAAVYVASLYSKKALRLAAIIAGSVAAAAVIALIACLCVYYASGDAEGNNGVTVTSTESLALYLCALALIAVIVALAFLFGRKDKKGFDSKSISYAAVCIALSFALSYLAPIHMPQGGSVTIASLVPLMIYSYMFGTRKGVFAGAIYGLLQIVQDPWIIHPAQMFLDYPIAFSYLAPDVDAWIYSLGYNATYVFPDIAIAIAVCVIVFCSKAFMRQVKKFSAPAAKSALPADEAPVSEAAPADEAPVSAAAPAQAPADKAPDAPEQ